MFRRKTYDLLKHWKDTKHGTTSILIEGARRVGKSALAMEFAANEYKAHLLIDFSVAPPEVIDLFRDYRCDMDAFFRYLFAYYNFTPIPRDTLIIFDEVQLCSEARAFTKQLVADGRYDYLETGSLISIQRNVQHILLPPEEESITLHPFDFEEFLWARDAVPLAGLIRDSFTTMTPLSEALRRQATRLFREYMLVGGMPHAIQAYVDENSFQAADESKRLILTLYKNDIAKFGAGEEARISAMFQPIPSQLARHEKRFRITSLGRNARNRTYEAAFFWLADAGLVNLCFNTTDPNVGLDPTANRNAFKCYFFDTGLLITQAFTDNMFTPEQLYKDVLSSKIDINEGMLTENVVAQQFAGNGHKLYYFSRNDPDTNRNRSEIDFLLAHAYAKAAGRIRISPRRHQVRQTLHDDVTRQIQNTVRHARRHRIRPASQATRTRWRSRQPAAVHERAAVATATARTIYHIAVCRYGERSSP